MMELTAEDIARRLDCHVRTARRWCDAWMGAQRRPLVPRVRLAPSGRRGRPAYAVDAASFERWLALGAVASNGDGAPAANDLD